MCRMVVCLCSWIQIKSNEYTDQWQAVCARQKHWNFLGHLTFISISVIKSNLYSMVVLIWHDLFLLLLFTLTTIQSQGHTLLVQIVAKIQSCIFWSVLMWFSSYPPLPLSVKESASWVTSTFMAFPVLQLHCTPSSNRCWNYVWCLEPVCNIVMFQSGSCGHSRGSAYRGYCDAGHWGDPYGQEECHHQKAACGGDTRWVSLERLGKSLHTGQVPWMSLETLGEFL